MSIRRGVVMLVAAAAPTGNGNGVKAFGGTFSLVPVS
jgi:hypothetical protein